MSWLRDLLFPSLKSNDDDDDDDDGLNDVVLNLHVDGPETCAKEGNVTRLEEGFRMIDHKYYWPDELRPISARGRKDAEETLFIGQRVGYKMERNNDKVEWRITEVEIVDDDYEEFDGDAKKPLPLFHHVALVVGAQKSGVEVQFGNSGQRTKIDRDDLRLDYEVSVGDLLDMELEDRETDRGFLVLSVRPLRRYDGAGYVYGWDMRRKRGVIEGNVLFNLGTCGPSYKPYREDRVRFAAVDCEPTNDNGWCNWRATKVTRMLDHSVVFAEVTNVVPGRRNKKSDRLGARFLAHKLKNYDIPAAMWRFPEELTDRHPSLCQPLSPANYSAKMSTMLHLEEIALAEQLARYEMEGVTLDSRGEYLGLVVPGLAEKRPSLMIGDSALVETSADGFAKVYEGCINEVRSNSILMSFHRSFHEGYGEETCRVRFKLNRSSFRKLHRAVETAFQILGEEFLFPTRVKLTLPQTILPVQCNLKMGEAVKKLDLDKYSGVLASYILPVLPAQRLISIIPVTSTKRQPLPCYQFSMDAREKKLASNGYLKSKYPSYTSKRTLKKLFTTPSSTFSWFNKRLNAEQKQAVFRVLKGEARPTPYIVFGPPGTGKTVTVVESVLQVFAFRSDARILVATPTNSSADLIAERLVPHVPAGALARLNAFQRAEEGIPDSIKAFCFSSEDVETVRAALRHRIIVATCSTSAGIFKLGLKNPPFTHAFLDEAGHMMEPEALIPIGLTSYLTGQIVMAGDPKQLGPVLQSAVAKSYGLHESLLERLSIRDMYMRNKRRFKGNCGGGYDPALVTLLKKNYRSNVNIIKVSSDLFYHSELEAMAQKDVTDKFLGVHFLPNPDFPVVFHALKGKQCQEADSPSWFNPVEGFQAVKYLQMLYELEGVRVNPDDVGIISPYRKQVEKIRSLIETLGLERVKVGSVEEFQGREKEVIIVSTVRVASNEDGVGGQLGFMNCEKRFNVAVTRAKSLLVVVGDPDVLTQERCWEEFVNFCVENRAYKGYEMAANIA